MSGILAQSLRASHITPPLVSLLIPAYQEAPRILQTLEAVRAYVELRDWSWEVIVIDDGSRDQTCEVVRRYAQAHPQVRLIELGRNRGKGAAVRAGALAAQGAYVCFCDADLAMPISHLGGLVAALRGTDIVIASRVLSESRVTVPQDPARWVMSRLFNRLVRAAFSLPYRDTQCGFKGFRRDAAQAVFSRSRIDGFAFDVELLLIARHLGLTIQEMPVEVRHSRLTTVNLASHTGAVCRDLCQIAQARRSGFPPHTPAQEAGRDTLSIVVITKNEERQIARCLESVRWADEIIIVDGESTDRTVEICRQFGAQVISHAFCGDFGHERNLGNDAATGDWILQLDADDTVTPQLRANIERVLREGSPHAAYKFRRKNWFLGHEMRHGGWYHYYPHFFRRGRATFEGRVHHLLKSAEPPAILEGDLEHRPFDSLEQFIARHNRYTTIEAQEMWDRQGAINPKVVRYHLTWRPLKLFWKTCVKKQGFREGWHGLVFSMLFAWVHFMKWVKHWEIGRIKAGGVDPTMLPPPSAEGPLGRGPRCHTLSIVLMAKNEEARLASCLDHVAGWADEIVVVDDCSADGTVEIARRYTDKVFSFASEDNHDLQWNRGIDRASGDWILHIDVDEVVTPQLRAAIDRALTDPQGHSAFEMMRKNYFLGRPMRYGGWYHRHLVLFRKDRARCIGAGIHVQLKVDGAIGFLDAALEHYPFSSLTQFIERQNHYTTVEARRRFERDGPVPAHILLHQLCWRPVKLFRKSYVKHEGRREGDYGLVFGLLFAFAHVMFWAKYWELGLRPSGRQHSLAGKDHAGSVAGQAAPVMQSEGVVHVAP